MGLSLIWYDDIFRSSGPNISILSTTFSMVIFCFSETRIQDLFFFVAYFSISNFLAQHTVFETVTNTSSQNSLSLEGTPNSKKITIRQSPDSIWNGLSGRYGVPEHGSFFGRLHHRSGQCHFSDSSVNFAMNDVFRRYDSSVMGHHHGEKFILSGAFLIFVFTKVHTRNLIPFEFRISSRCSFEFHSMLPWCEGMTFWISDSWQCRY